MHPDLMGAPGFEAAGEQARHWRAIGARIAFEHFPMGHCGTAVRAHGHLGARARMARDRRRDRAFRPCRGAPDEGEIAALERPAAAMVGELAAEGMMGAVGL